MKITTRLFNEEFLDARAALNPTDNDVWKGLANEQNTVLAKDKKIDASDLEDIRLNKMRVMQD